MMKKEFIHELKLKLKSFNHIEVDKIIDFYSELIDEKIESGMKEEAAIKSFGDIDLIVKRVSADLVIERIDNKSSKPITSFLIILGICASPILIPIGIGFFAVFISIFITFFSIIFAFFISSIAVFAGSIVYAYEMYKLGHEFSSIFLMLGVAFIVSSVLMLLTIYTAKISKYILNLIVRAFSSMIKKKTKGQKI